MNHVLGQSENKASCLLLIMKLRVEYFDYITGFAHRLMTYAREKVGKLRGITTNDLSKVYSTLSLCACFINVTSFRM